LTRRFPARERRWRTWSPEGGVDWGGGVVAGEGVLGGEAGHVADLGQDPPGDHRADAKQPGQPGARSGHEQLLHELTSRSIPRVVFERRHAELDARDRALITALQRRHALATSFQATWLPPADEPLLWLPDIAAGAASLAETGDTTYWQSLSAAFEVIRFGLA
jgi:hypothetical protein